MNWGDLLEIGCIGIVASDMLWLQTLRVAPRITYERNRGWRSFLVVSLLTTSRSVLFNAALLRNERWYGQIYALTTPLDAAALLWAAIETTGNCVQPARVAGTWGLVGAVTTLVGGVVFGALLLPEPTTASKFRHAVGALYFLTLVFSIAPIALPIFRYDAWLRKNQARSRRVTVLVSAMALIRIWSLIGDTHEATQAMLAAAEVGSRFAVWASYLFVVLRNQRTVKE